MVYHRCVSCRPTRRNRTAEIGTKVAQGRDGFLALCLFCIFDSGLLRKTKRRHLRNLLALSRDLFYYERGAWQEVSFNWSLDIRKMDDFGEFTSAFNDNNNTTEALKGQILKLKSR